LTRFGTVARSGFPQGDKKIHPAKVPVKKMEIAAIKKIAAR
jgi:hypothetical protein